jgi:CRISPR system Cascade subunit CasE
MHALIENSFQGGRGETGRKLWRVDLLVDNLYLLMLSRSAPDFAYLAEQLGKPGRGGKSLEYDRLLNNLNRGQIWHFRLCANPVVSERKPELKRVQLRAHTATQYHKKWLIERSEKNGFLLDEDSFGVTECDCKKFSRRGATVTIGTAVYEGLLTITDTSLLTAALQNGIGRAKAYGCGMLTLAKAK